MLIQAFKTGNLILIIGALLASAFLVFVALPIHEWAHAIVAYKCGDNTPKLAGGLTLNPLAHIDPLGAVLIVLTGFGWGKPTPVNPQNFRHPRWDNVLVAYAGPMSNLLMGWLFYFLDACFNQIPVTSTGGRNVLMLVCYFFGVAGTICFMLAVFNLLPIPMFDGFTLIEALMPDHVYNSYQQHRNMISIIVLLVFLPLLFSASGLENLFNYVYHFFWWLCYLPFGGSGSMPSYTPMG